MEGHRMTGRLTTRDAGFSLVEALIASALVLMITLGVMPLFTHAVVQNVSGKESTISTNYSRSAAEELVEIVDSLPETFCTTEWVKSGITPRVIMSTKADAIRASIREKPASRAAIRTLIRCLSTAFPLIARPRSSRLEFVRSMPDVAVRWMKNCLRRWL